MADQNDQPPPIANVEAEGDAEGDAAVAQVAAQVGVGDVVPQLQLQQQQQDAVVDQANQQQAVPANDAGVAPQQVAPAGAGGVPPQAAPVGIAGGGPQQAAPADAVGGAPAAAQGVPAAGAGLGNLFGVDPAAIAAAAVAADPQGDAAAIAAAAVGAAMAAAAAANPAALAAAAAAGAAAANAAGGVAEQAAPGAAPNAGPGAVPGAAAAGPGAVPEAAAAGAGQGAPGAVPGAAAGAGAVPGAAAGAGAVPGAAAGAGAVPGAAAGAGAGLGGQPHPNAGPGPAGPGVAGGPQPQAGAANANPGMAGGQGPGAGMYMTADFMANLFRTFMATGVVSAVSRKKPEVKLPQFSSALPAEWRDFRKLAENARVTNKWTDEEAKRVVFSQCVGEAGQRVRLVPIGGNPDAVPRPADAKTYEQYMNDIQIRFQPKGASALAYSEFISAKQQLTEDFQAFHTRLEGLFCLAEPLVDPQTSKSLLRVFIQGLRDKVIATWLLDKDPETYARALELAQERLGHFAMVRQGNPTSAGGKTPTSFIHAFGHTDVEDADEYLDAAAGVGAINYHTGAKAVSTKSANKNLRRYGPNYASKLQSNDRQDGCERCGGNHPTYNCWQRYENNNNNNNSNKRGQSRPGAKSSQKKGGRPWYNNKKGKGGGQGSGRNVSVIENNGRNDDYSFDESVAALHGLKDGLKAAFRSAVMEGN